MTSRFKKSDLKSMNEFGGRGMRSGGLSDRVGEGDGTGGGEGDGNGVVSEQRVKLRSITRGSVGKGEEIEEVQAVGCSSS